MSTAYAQKCNWCDWNGIQELVSNCPDCGKEKYLMDLPKLDKEA